MIFLDLLNPKRIIFEYNIPMVLGNFSFNSATLSGDASSPETVYQWHFLC
jgi:hypothetical protein